jgi:predicted O-linked N-acetylglucosamine transferase (SPINDLY family)
MASLVRGSVMARAAELFAAAQEHHRAGRLAEAGRLYQSVLEAEPDHSDALHYLGTLDFQAGRLGEAEAKIRRSIALKSNEPAARVNLGRVLRHQGRLDDAAGEFRAALAIEPQRVSALFGLNDVLSAQRRYAEALEAAREAVAIAPQDPGAHYSLGVVQQALGQLDAAEIAYRRAASLAPGFAEAHNNLGFLLLERGDAGEAAKQLELAIRIAPSLAAAHNNLGKAFHELGRFDDALASYRQAITLEPLNAAARVNIGTSLRNQGRLAQAEAELRRAVTDQPDLADAHYNLGVVWRDLGRLDEAAEALRRAVSLAPVRAEFHATAGLIANDRGVPGEAGAHCRRAVALRPDSISAHRQLLATTLYDPDLTQADRWQVHAAFGAAMEARVTRPFGRITSDRDPARRLRIGYVSSDLRNHPVGRNFEQVLALRDRRNFEVFAYADIAVPDAMTDRLKGLVDVWRPGSGLSDQQLAEQIRADRIDILVLMAGRFDRNRPQLAAWRVAPVQVSFNDPATSGIAEMDYLIADRILAPRGGNEKFSERVIRLPSFYIHAPLSEAPAVKPPPRLARGYPTFGCFNNPAKLNDGTLRCWAELLAAVPEARLSLHFKNWYSSTWLQDRVRRALGAQAERVSFDVGERRNVEHLAAYDSVDVALDPYPFTGSTTTFEALWMGVPVVTLLGETMVGRWSALMLHALKLDELVARTPRDYVEIAASLAKDGARLAAFRAGLRDKVSLSPLCDGARRARQMDRLYRVLWRRWCGGVS